MLKEYVGHVLIGTSLEAPARAVRDLGTIRKRLFHPELKDMLLEPSRIEQLLTQVIQDGMNCIDVGAHIGSILNRITSLSPTGKHIAVEAIPYKANWLKQKFPTVEVMQIALSDTAGMTDFYIHPHRSGCSGLRLYERNTSHVELIQVRTALLDSECPSDRSIDFMKIDVEGAELAVLRGSQGILQRSRPTILFECTRPGLQAFNFTPKDIYDFLVQKYCYSLYLVKDWLNSDPPLNFDRFVQAMQYPYPGFNFLAVNNKFT